MQTQLDFEKLKFLYSVMPIIMAVQFVSAILFALIMWHNVNGTVLGVWIIAMTVISLFRLYHYTLYSNSSDEELRLNSTSWLKRYYNYLLISGAMWGSAAFFLFPEKALFYQMVVVLFSLGITATGLGIISASWPHALIFSLLSFAPLILRLGWMEEPLYQTIAYIISALAILMIFTAKHLGSMIEHAIYGKFAFSQAEQQFESSNSHSFILLENAPVGILYYDQNLRITNLNARMLKNLRVGSRDELIGYDLNLFGDKRIQPAFRAALNNEEGHYEGLFHSAVSEQVFYVELHTVPISDDKHRLLGGVCFFRDMTSEREAQETIKRHTLYDPLTKLPNRLLFIDRVRLAVEQSKRHRFRCAVLLVDLDHFKQINDEHGHYVGDQLLYKVSQRLLDRVRSEDTVARIGGDEFLILLNALTYDETEAHHTSMEIAEELIDIIEGEYVIEKQTVTISASVGVFVFAGDEIEDPTEIIKHADVAMYQAKRTGRSHAEGYHADFENAQQKLLGMEKELRRGLDHEEFELYYQPKVSVETDKIVQVEALIRWNHPERGVLLPDDFIPFAEENGLILKLGEWVMQESIRQIKEWRQNDATASIERVAINVSLHQFNQPDFVDHVKSLVTSHAISPSMIELELTETVMLDHTMGAIEKIEALEAFGIRVALDDFGTGYSSLSYLKHLPVSVVKIDRSFISDLKHNRNSLMIVKTIVNIAKDLGLTVVAEGVETQEELALLKELECDYYQGFVFEKPLPAEKLQAFIDAQAADQADRTVTDASS